MTACDRRQFLSQTGKLTIAAAGTSLLANAQSVWGAPANEKIILGFIGAGGRGRQLCGGFMERTDCEVAWVADPSLPKAETLAASISKKRPGQTPKAVQDCRKMLDDKSVDAVVIATPDHWHALHAIWACQAGKDVYVEKPASYCCWEGPKMIEAARKYKRIMQVGTQSRSAPYAIAAKKYIADGKLGEIHFCRVYNQKGPSVWPVVPDTPDGDPPADFDWDLFNGPAPEAKYNVKYPKFWHHFWRYSSGDIVNDAVHQLDLARFVLGVGYPKSVYSTGGRFGEEGVSEMPDTQVASYNFDGLVMTLDLTLYTPYMLKISPLIRQSETEFPYWLQCATRVEIYGSKGLMIIGRHGGGWQVFTRPKLHEGVVVDQQKGLFPDPEHKQNFFDCIRTRNTPNADIVEGHRSALLPHLANISYRMGGEKLVYDAEAEKIVGNDEAMKYFRREHYRKPYTIGETV